MNNNRETFKSPYLFAFTADTPPQHYFEVADRLVLRALEKREQAEKLQEIVQALHKEADDACEYAETLQRCGSLERQAVYELLTCLLETFKDILPLSEFTSHDIEGILKATENGHALLSDVQAFGSRLEASCRAQALLKGKVEESNISDGEGTTFERASHKSSSGIPNPLENLTAECDGEERDFLPRKPTKVLKTSLDLPPLELMLATHAINTSVQDQQFYGTKSLTNDSKQIATSKSHEKPDTGVHHQESLEKWVQSYTSRPNSVKQEDQIGDSQPKKKRVRRRGKRRDRKISGSTDAM